MITAIKQRENIVPAILDILSAYGWLHNKTPIDKFTYDTDRYHIAMSARFSDYAPGSYVTNFYIQFKEVVAVFLKLGINPPGYNLSIDNGNLYTIHDYRFVQKFSPSNMGMTTADIEHFKDQYGRPLKNSEDLSAWAASVQDYIHHEGKEFIEEYKYLPNVLKQMDSDFSQNGQWNILWGSILNGLVVSKLCSDVNYDEKFLYIENQIFNTPFYHQRHPAWMDFWKEFIEVMEHVKPIYPYYASLNAEDIKKLNPNLFA